MLNCHLPSFIATTTLLALFLPAPALGEQTIRLGGVRNVTATVSSQMVPTESLSRCCPSGRLTQRSARR